MEMKEQFIIYTARNGEKYIQTKNKYLAHGLAFCGFRFMVFRENENEIFSFCYSQDLIDAIENISNIRANIMFG